MKSWSFSVFAVLVLWCLALGFARGEAISPPSTGLPPPLQSVCTSVSPAIAKQWMGNYRAEEHSKDKQGAPQTVTYQVGVSRDEQGVIRATVTTSGSTDSQRLFTCGEVRKTQLILRLIQLEGGGNLPEGRQFYQPALTLETDGPHAWMMGFPGVPYQLLKKPALPAKKLSSSSSEARQ